MSEPLTLSGSRPSSGSNATRARGRAWLVPGLGVVTAVAFAVGAYLLIRHFDLEAVAAALEPLGRHWYALPLAVLAFVVLSMLMLSVLAMTVIAGWVFGPWLGSVCGLAGSLCSAATAFWIGRRLGQTAIEKLGARVRNISRDLGENGVLAAFLLRKIPAPFTIVNMIAGASRIRFRDFMLGTLLGMGAVVVLLAVFGDGLRQGLQGGSPTGPVLATGAALLVVAIVLNAVVKRRRRRAP